MRLASLAVVVLLVAGCASKEAPAPVPVADVVEDEPVWQHFEQTYPLKQTEVHVPVTSNASGGNCVMLDDDALVDGTATVTWNPTVTTPEMELVLNGPDDLKFKTGDGKIVLDLHQVQVGGRRPGSALAWQISQGAVAGVVMDLEGTLVLSVDVLLDDPEQEFTPEDNWGCAIGH
ncbi:MAG: hypothetical protein QOJ26_696 [Thermoplasmata archaeon]|jgi:hypothetical protein|nr:hypothetical protein [Thermoplasmata archaeon]